VGRDFGTAWVLVARKSGSDSSTVVFLLACCHDRTTLSTHDGTHSYLSFRSDFNYFSVPQQRCWLKEKVAKRVGVAILNIGSKRLQGVK
jgi:hypothetical protein